MASLNPLSIFNALTPKDETPESLLKWRQLTAGVLTIMILALGTSPWTLDLRFITDAKAEEEHTEIQKELGMIRGDLTALVQSDQARAEREKQQEIRNLRESIFNTRLRACSSEGATRQVLMAQVTDLRSQYRDLVGEEFPTLNCDELLGVN